ncbi:MAG TPA: GNAT family protein [Acidimicrobiia bacterium]|nr:GNAT family protein [Acidimicrobiia bacterium]
MDVTIWPFAALRIRTPALELRYPDDDDLCALARLSAEGIHDPGSMPFLVPWTRVESPDLERNVLQWHWGRRSSLTRDDWSLPFVVCVDGEPVGVQDLFATHFAIRRTVETGSWLVQRAQGRGIGSEMRAAVLQFAFAALGAEEALSGSFVDNPTSAAVSRRNGYDPNGEEIVQREGEPARLQRWVLTRARWTPRRRDDITIAGLDACLRLLT